MTDAKSLLDSLMGNDRNAGKKDGQRSSWRDNAICKNFMVWECPCDFFMNESGRVGHKQSPFRECSLQHSEAMQNRFKEDKDYRKFKHRYLTDLEKQLQEKIKAMDDRVASDKDALIMKIEAEKDKLEASGKMDDKDNLDLAAAADFGRPRRKDEPDEVCEVCGTYSAFTGALVMRHDAGILHVGWRRLRDSFAGLQKEVKASKEGLTTDELIGPTEGRERSRSIEVRKNRDQRRDQKDGRKDIDETRDRDRDRDRDMRREHDQKSRARERDTHSDREYEKRSRGQERDAHSDRGRDRYDERRHRDARDQDRDKGRRRGDDSGNGQRGRSRKEEDVDDFGRAKVIHKEYRDGQHSIKEEDKRGIDNRSRSREDASRQPAAKDERVTDDRSQSRDACKSTASWIQDTEDCKILRVELSEDWQEVMNKECQESKLSMTVWDMACIDCDDGVVDMGGTSLSADSFPLRFKFTRKA